jgi:DNA-binding NarL/FixJ family response regulator
MVYISSGTRILTITDDPSFYLRVHYAFARERGIEIMLTSNTTFRGLKRIKELEPDIILIDGELPDNDAISVCGNILHDGYSGNIILFEMDFTRARNACEVGVTTCFPREIGYRELLSGIRLIRQSYSFYS